MTLYGPVLLLGLDWEAGRRPKERRETDNSLCRVCVCVLIEIGNAYALSLNDQECSEDLIPFENQSPCSNLALNRLQARLLLQRSRIRPAAFGPPFSAENLKWITQLQTEEESIVIVIAITIVIAIVIVIVTIIITITIIIIIAERA